MDLNNDQYTARKLIHDWFRDGGERPFFLGGLAGTGKTTLIKHLLAESRNPGGIAVLAPTNKAARVLREKGVSQAETIHRFLYGAPAQGVCDCGTQTKNHDAKCPALKLHFLPRGMSIDGVMVDEEIPPSLIVVDEASMVNEKLATDLIAKGVPILAVGDIGQLPPVEGKPGFPTPDYVLRTIQRQALDNPIVRMAHDVRDGKILRAGSYGESVVSDGSLAGLEFDTDDWDQILTWRHSTRCAVNDRYRRLFGRTSLLPEVGENVMFKSTHKELGIANGDVYPVLGIAQVDGRDNVDLRLKMGEAQAAVSAWRLGFGNAEDWKTLDTMDFRYKRFHARCIYDYAITVHSAQGSEWDRVIVVQEGNREPKWLYTAITRAAKRVMVLRGR